VVHGADGIARAEGCDGGEMTRGQRPQPDKTQRHKTQLILSSATQISDRCVASPVLSPSLSVGTPILSRSASQRFVIGWSG
jgi:hypothetical protein